MMGRLNRAIAAVLLLLVRGYRRLISPLTPPSCRFFPTCSTYALTAIERFGPWHGSRLAIARILRCQPLHPGGYDPVPETLGAPTIDAAAALKRRSFSSDGLAGRPSPLDPPDPPGSPDPPGDRAADPDPSPQPPASDGDEP